MVDKYTGGMEKDIVTEGDTCPECEVSKVVASSWTPFHLHCPNCGAEWDERGKKIGRYEDTEGLK